MNFDTLSFLGSSLEQRRRDEKKYFKVVKFYLVYSSTNHAKKDNVEQK